MERFSRKLATFSVFLIAVLQEIKGKTRLTEEVSKREIKIRPSSRTMAVPPQHRGAAKSPRPALSSPGYPGTAATTYRSVTVAAATATASTPSLRGDSGPKCEVAKLFEKTFFVFFA